MFEDIISDIEEDKGLSYSDFMNAVVKFHMKYWNMNACDLCGGTGFVPVMCCNLDSCGCKGMPVDFYDHCMKCGEKGDYTKL